MDSNNWRIERDPADSSPSRDQNGSFRQRRDRNRSSGVRVSYTSGMTNTSRESSRQVNSQPLSSISVGYSRFRGGLNSLSQSRQREEHDRRSPANDSPDLYCNASRGDPASSPYRPPIQPSSFNRQDRSKNSKEKKQEESQTLYVGGLPKFDDQAGLEADIRELFKNFKVTNVSKQFSPPEHKKRFPVTRYFVFVNLATAQECEQAVATLDGVDRWNWRIRINLSFTPTVPQTNKLNETHSPGQYGKPTLSNRLFVGGLPEFLDQEATESSMRELFDGFELQNISKLFRPNELFTAGKGKDCFCFIDLADSEQADRARLKLDWGTMWGGEVRVKIATPNGGGGQKKKERATKDEHPSRGWRE